MEYRVLGPFDVRRGDERVALGSFKQRSLLALLLIHANQVVSTDRIVDELWGEDVPTDRQNALWVHVSKLRSALEPTRSPRSEGTLILTRPPGYVLRVEDGELDAWRFEQLVGEGRGLIDIDPAAASIVLAEALALWRGHPYEDFTYDSFARAEVARLEGMRVEAVEARIDADLRRGLAAELVGELESLVGQHPFREGFTGANDPSFVRRFEAEAEVVARLEHPHIVPVYDYWREPDAAYVVTRLFRGGTLADALLEGELRADRSARWHAPRQQRRLLPLAADAPWR